MKHKKKNLIIYGDSSYAGMIAHYFQTDSEYQVVAFCVDRDYKTREKIGDLPVVALEDIENIKIDDIIEDSLSEEKNNFIRIWTIKKRLSWKKSLRN